MFTCSNCDEPYPSYGDCSGVCESCRDERELRAEIEAMSDEEYARFKARHFSSVWRAVNNLKVA